MTYSGSVEAEQQGSTMKRNLALAICGSIAATLPAQSKQVHGNLAETVLTEGEIISEGFDADANDAKMVIKHNDRIFACVLDFDSLTASDDPDISPPLRCWDND